MNKKFLSYKYHNLHPHHIYQMGIIFLFVFVFFLMFPFYLLVDEYHLDMTRWQWYYVAPWMTFYTIYCLKLRAKTLPYERISPLKRHIAYWVLLGLGIVLIHLQPIDLERIYSIDFAFGIFSIFLADSYWDFRQLRKRS